MFCSNCGQKVPDDAAFCENCGMSLSSIEISKEEKETLASGEFSDFDSNLSRDGLSVQKMKSAKRSKRKASGEGIERKEDIQGTKVTDNIYLCPDGAYRWVYEFDMLKNPTILITTWKVLLIAFGVVMAFMLILQLFEGGFSDFSDFIGFYGPFLILIAVMLALGAVAYLIVAQSYGWRYMVLFTMTDTDIEHRQMKSQFKKAEAIGWLTAAAGLVSGNIGRAGTGILAATKDASVCTFERVKKVKAVRNRNVIYVNETLEHNQIYAENSDFDFVERFIRERCINVK